MNSSAPLKHIATYGTLTIPSVMRALLGTDFTSDPIVFEGYKRFTLSGKIYPGLIVSPGSRVDGKIYFDLDLDSVKILDKFEDEFYDKAVIPVHTPSRGLVEAQAYLLPLSLESQLSDSPWSAEAFCATHLANYLERCKKFREKVLK